MDISSSHKGKDRISDMPDDILFDCLSLLEMKNAAQTGIISRRWRHLWTHLTNLDFDPEVMYPEEADTFWDNHKYETRKYFAWINQVVRVHQGQSIDKFRVHSRYVTSFENQIDKWVKFALSKRVKELVLDFIGIMLECADRSKKGFPLGFDTLRHPPCYTGITALQSLHLRYVNVSEEFLEFLLVHCQNLERLYLDSTPLSNFKVKTSKLKYLSIIMRYSELKELEIDAENLLYFLYDGSNFNGGTRMVLKSLPMLVETSFHGDFCKYPFPVFEQLSLFSVQLCKLTLEIQFDMMARGSSLFIPDGVIPTFPNVKHFTCTIMCYDYSCILQVKRFIEACPILKEFKLQVIYVLPLDSEEATELLEISLEEKEGADVENEERNTNASEIGQVPEAEVQDMNEEMLSHPNLSILELVGFLGTRCDVGFALAVVSYARSLKKIICDTLGVRYVGRTCFLSDGKSEYDVGKRRAHKLAKIVSPKVKVVII